MSNDATNNPEEMDDGPADETNIPIDETSNSVENSTPNLMERKPNTDGGAVIPPPFNEDENSGEPIEYPEISDNAEGANIQGKYMKNGYAFTLDKVTDARYQVSEQEFEEAKAKLAYLKSLVEKSLKYYSGERNSARRWAFVFTMFSTVLAGTVTILLGWRFLDPDMANSALLPNIALVLSAMITIMGVMSKFWDAKQLWVRYTDTENALKRLMGYIEYTEQGLDKVKALRLVEVEALNLKYHMILQATNRLIHDVRAQN